MANTARVDKELFQQDHYLGKPADDTDRIVDRRISILKEYPAFFGPYSLIEVGCGSGATITRLGKEFTRKLGIDIFDYADDFERQKLKNECDSCEFQKTDLEKEVIAEKFDRLVSFEVIEHFSEERTVSKMADLLNAGGMAAISVPNKWWIFETHGARLPLLPWNRVPFFSWLPTPVHERFANARIYTRKRIRRLMESSGFEVIDLRLITAPMDVLKDGKLKKFLTTTLFKGDTTRNPFLSTSIFVLARKK